MALNRNTKPASEAASKRALERRRALQEHIRGSILPDWCPRPDGCSGCTETSIQTCMSHKELARTLNTFNVRSLRGKTDGWEVTMVRNLFKDEVVS